MDKVNDYPKISVVTVCFNSVTTIEQTILSVVNQTYKNIEYIIIDGDSTDGTTDIIRKYRDKIAYWVSEPDEGVYDAMNKGVKTATGDYIYFLCSGDLLKPEIFHKIKDKLILKNNHFVYGDVFMNHRKCRYDGKFNKYKIVIRNICHQAIFYHKSVFEFLGLYNLNYPICADYYFNILCFANAKLKKVYVNEVIAVYEGNGISDNAVDAKFQQDFLMIIKNNFEYKFYVIGFFIKKIRGMLEKLKIKRILKCLFKR